MTLPVHGLVMLFVMCLNNDMKHPKLQLALNAEIQLGKLRGGDKKWIDQKIDPSRRSNALIWSCLQSLNKTPFLEDPRGKANPYNHWVKEKI